MDRLGIYYEVQKKTENADRLVLGYTREKSRMNSRFFDLRQEVTFNDMGKTI